jgi:hypothetical protein
LVEVKLVEGKGAAPTGALEKAKRKWVSSLAGPTKRSRILDAVLHPSPLHSKGESEDAMSEDSHCPSGEATPPAPKKVVPVNVAPACLDLEFSTAIESSDEGGEEEVRVKIDSPPFARGARSSWFWQ